MTLRVKISARAAAQIRQAAEWWNINRPAAPGAVATGVGESSIGLMHEPLRRQHPSMSTRLETCMDLSPASPPQATKGGTES